MLALPRPSFRSVAFLLVAGALAACGGTSFTTAGSGGASAGSTTGPTGAGGGSSDTSATTGAGGAGGSGVAASTSDTSSTGTGEFVCPPEKPDAGSACEGEGTCPYTDPVACCNVQLECSGGSWHVAGKMCGTPPCPPDLPATGSACGCDQVCNYGSCANGTAVSATCSGGQWSTGPAQCIACGNTSCDPGQVCFQQYGGVGDTATCVQDPCNGNQLDCSCAKPILCPDAVYECSTSGDATVICKCTVCQ